MISIATLFLIASITWVFSNRFVDALRMEVESERLRSAVLMARAAAHELRQPMTVVSGFAEILKDKVNTCEALEGEAEIIVDQCARMDGIISKMLGVTMFKTKAYDDDTEIFDLGTEKREDGTDN